MTSQGLCYLNTQTPANLKDYRSQRKQSITGKSCLFTGGRAWRFLTQPHILFTLWSWLHLRPVFCSFSHTLRTMIYGELQTKIHHSSLELHSIKSLISATRNATNTLDHVAVFECSLWSLGMGSRKHGSLNSKCTFSPLFRKRFTFLWRFGSITQVGEPFAYFPHEGRLQST